MNSKEKGSLMAAIVIVTYAAVSILHPQFWFI